MDIQFVSAVLVLELSLLQDGNPPSWGKVSCPDIYYTPHRLSVVDPPHYPVIVIHFVKPLEEFCGVEAC